MSNVPLESYEQIALANYLRRNNYLFYKSPSETYTTSWNQKRKNKLEWVTKWFPDTCIVLKRGALLFVELKRCRNVLKNWTIWASPSTVSQEQIEWVDQLNKIFNVQANICYGHKEAIEVIERIEKV